MAVNVRCLVRPLELHLADVKPKYPSPQSARTKVTRPYRASFCFIYLRFWDIVYLLFQAWMGRLPTTICSLRFSNRRLSTLIVHSVRLTDTNHIRTNTGTTRTYANAYAHTHAAMHTCTCTHTNTHTCGQIQKGYVLVDTRGALLDE